VICRAFLLLVLVVVGVDAAAMPSVLTPTRRLAVLVAHHDGGPTRPLLQHAATDAAAVRDVLVEVGGVDERDVRMVVDKDAQAVEEALAAVSDTVTQVKARGERIELVVYYSGHADEDGLVLGREHLPWGRLRASVSDITADVKVVVLDACASGSAVRDKGGRRRPPLLVDARTAPRGHAWLTSSAADEASQESDRLGGSFFTHAFVSGLRGAADVSADGQVTLDEAYRFAFQETLARTMTSTGGAQHANYDIQLSGSGELVLTDLRDTSGRLVLGNDVGGRVFVRDLGERRLVAEVTKLKGFALPLALPPGGYDVVVVEGTQAARATARVTAQGAVVSAATLDPVDLESAVPRGLFPLTRFPINFAFVSPLEINSYAPRVENNLSLSLLFGRAARINGATLAVGGNFVDEQLTGTAMAVGFNGVSGPVHGAMLGGSNIALSDVTGVMGGAFFNLGQARTVGAAWAVANVHHDITGVQFGLVNVADTVTGAQVGLINIARTSTGTQLGLINLARTSTAPIGVISLVRDGQLGAGLFASDFALLGIEARAGSPHVFTQVRAGATPLLRSDGGVVPVVSLGLGTSWAFDRAGIDVDLSAGLAGPAPFAALGTRLRWRPTPLVSLSIGPEVRVLAAHSVQTQPWAIKAGSAIIWPGLVVGVGL
jgi:hypothetical protein